MSTTTTSGGEVDLGSGESVAGLTSHDVRVMSAANMIAHVVIADSLEVVFARAGAANAQDSAVLAFAKRMVLEHSDHVQTATQYGVQNGVSPMLFAADTADAFSTTLMLSRLSADSGSADFDRRFIDGEVEMHLRILRDLMMMQPQASDLPRQLIDQTIPMVREHLADARRISKQLAAGTGS